MGSAPNGVFRVGGAVRDQLLGLPVQDIDYVVVGSTPEQLIEAGYTPVGKDFPVFLHPTSKAEYALARTERKSAPGYRGFVFHCDPTVTLEQDLQRRDLTINAMAIPESETDVAAVIDPFGGQRDLAARIFRHVSDAFSEDPVRILRIARFAARFADFTVAPETLQLMRVMVDSGEVDALVSERVWQEIARGLMELHPARMLATLQESAALDRIIPELHDTVDADLLQTVNFSAQQHMPLGARWAVICTSLTPEVLLRVCQRLKVPAEIRDIALIATREQRPIAAAINLSANSIVQLLERCDAFRRPSRFVEIVQAVRCANRATSADFPQLALLQQSLASAQNIAAGDIARQVTLQFPNQPQRIAESIYVARAAAIQALINIPNRDTIGDQ